MNKRATWLVVALAVAIGLAFWAPWLSAARAERRAEAAFESAWAGVIDGCGLSCSGCGAVDGHWAPFGTSVTLEYACGMIPEDSAEYHQRTTGFVPSFGPVIGFGEP